MPFEWPEGFARSVADADAALVLASLPSLHARRLAELSTRFPTASGCLAAARRGQSVSPADREHARVLVPEEIRTALCRSGSRAVLPGTPEYPRGLFDLDDPPVALFVIGRSLREMVPGVAVIGARSCSPTGREVAESIGRGLARAGITVVSGAARGIDAASQRGALQMAGATIAVLGSGIDIAYPRSSVGLIQQLASEGSVVSEYPPGVPAAPFRFPARNRIIAGLSRGVVVVEGAARSGTLITGDVALDIGRRVYAVPGAVTSPLSEVPLSLIRDGARAIGGIDDLLHDLGVAEGSALLPIDVLTPIEGAALRAVKGPTLPEQVAAELGWGISQALGALMQLEMRGLVANRGGRFERRVLA